MRLFRRGRKEAFAVLVRRYEGELYGYLRRYLGDPELADDVFQNSFVQIFRKIDQYELDRPVRPWIYAIATNQAIDAVRRKKRRQTLRLEVERDENDPSPGSVCSLQSSDPAPLDRLQTEERRKIVRSSVDELPEFLKQVVILAYYQGMKHKDVSDILGIPVGTVKSRLHTALQRLQEAWRAAPAFQD